VVIARRAREEKETVALRTIAKETPKILQDDQQELLAQATQLRDERTRSVGSPDEALDAASDGFARLPWRTCGEPGEERLAQAGISVRCLVRVDGQPVDDADADGVDALVARAY
jgi:prolyl-tRNA synthetase